MTTLDKQVCSLELAKRLKELGVKQESLFWWYFDKKQNGNWGEPNDPKYLHLWDVTYSAGLMDVNTEVKLSAFTVVELLELLPNALMGPDPEHQWHQLLLEKQATQYKAMYVCASCKGVLVGIEHGTAADALAATLANMIESKLITL